MELEMGARSSSDSLEHEGPSASHCLLSCAFFRALAFHFFVHGRFTFMCV